MFPDLVCARQAMNMAVEVGEERLDVFDHEWTGPGAESERTQEIVKGNCPLA